MGKSKAVKKKATKKTRGSPLANSNYVFDAAEHKWLEVTPPDAPDLAAIASRLLDKVEPLRNVRWFSNPAVYWICLKFERVGQTQQYSVNKHVIARTAATYPSGSGFSAVARLAAFASP